MKFLAGFVTAIVLIFIGALVVTVMGVYNVAATFPQSELERVILGNVMRYSVRTHSGHDVSKTWNNDQIREGFQEYNEMCVYCHDAPGKEARTLAEGYIHYRPIWPKPLSDGKIPSFSGSSRTELI